MSDRPQRTDWRNRWAYRHDAEIASAQQEHPRDVKLAKLREVMGDAAYETWYERNGYGCSVAKWEALIDAELQTRANDTRDLTLLDRFETLHPASDEFRHTCEALTGYSKPAPVAGSRVGQPMSRQEAEIIRDRHAAFRASGGTYNDLG